MKLHTSVDAHVSKLLQNLFLAKFYHGSNPQYNSINFRASLTETCNYSNFVREIQAFSHKRSMFFSESKFAGFYWKGGMEPAYLGI